MNNLPSRVESESSSNYFLKVVVVAVMSVFLFSSCGENKESVEALEKKSSLGSLDASFELYKRYAEGDGVEKDVDIAKSYLQKGVKANHSESLYEYAVLLESGEGIYKKNLYASMNLYHSSSSFGSKEGAMKMGDCYEKGLIGCKIDLERSRDYYKKANSSKDVARLDKKIQTAKKIAIVERYELIQKEDKLLARGLSSDLATVSHVKSDNIYEYYNGSSYVKGRKIYVRISNKLKTKKLRVKVDVTMMKRTGYMNLGKSEESSFITEVINPNSSSTSYVSLYGRPLIDGTLDLDIYTVEEVTN